MGHNPTHPYILLGFIFSSSPSKHFGQFATPYFKLFFGLLGHFQCSKWLSCHWLSISDGHRTILMLALFVPVAAVQTGQTSRHFCQFRHTFFKPPLHWPRKDFLDIFVAQKKDFDFVLICAWAAVQTGYLYRQFCYLSRWGGVTLVDFTLACCQPNVVINCKSTLQLLPFTLSLDTSSS